MIEQSTFERIDSLDLTDENRGHTIFHLLASTGEEYGELCRAVNKEHTNGFADEPAYMEAVDLIVCGLAIYSRLTEGNFKYLNEEILAKLAKWEKNQNVSL